MMLQRAERVSDGSSRPAFRRTTGGRAGGLLLVVGLLTSLPGSGCNSQGGFDTRLGPGSEITLKIKDREIQVEIASDTPSRRVGLMGRKPDELPVDSGMLFVFEKPEKVQFHMKNTLIPLSIAFIAPEGEILQIEDMKPKDLSQTWSKDEVQFALEMHQGWFRRNGIQVGDRLEGLAELKSSLGVR